jgi:O-antigen/teichoic acid export membrane protein
LFADRNFDAFTCLIYRFIKISAALSIIGIPLAVVLGRQALSFLYRPEYANYINVFLIMIVTTSMFAVASFLGYGLTAARCFTSPLIIVGSSTLTAVCSSLLLIPRFGLTGAAGALLMAALVQVAGFAFGLHLELKKAKVLATQSITQQFEINVTY